MLPDAGIAGPVASANAASATPKGGNQDHMVLAPPKTCLWGGKRYARNRVRVPGLTAVSQAIGCRKVPAYRPKPMKGGDAKSAFLSLGPSPRCRFIVRLATLQKHRAAASDHCRTFDFKVINESATAVRRTT
jgi:hypothetical protein